MLLPNDPKDRERFLKEQQANGGYTSDGQQSHVVVDLAKEPHRAGGIVGSADALPGQGGSLVDPQSNDDKTARLVRKIARGFGLQEANPTLHELVPIATELLEAVNFDESKINVESARGRLKAFGFIR